VKILLTNDDGIAAEGLAVLTRIARQLSDDVWICAPEMEQSGASRALTLTDPVRVRQLDERTFAVAGTPTDCVMLAMQEFMPTKPDLVLSGVNRGQNMGEDVTFSGTVAGALQGMTLGVPSIALSQTLRGYTADRVARFQVSEAFAPGIIEKLVEAGWPPKVIININFPDMELDEVTGVEVTTQGFRDAHPLHFEKRMDLRGRAYYWMGYNGSVSTLREGTDMYAIKQGRISVTPLHIDLTHRETCHDLRAHLGGAPPKLSGAKLSGALNAKD
jgi:5'-nucleotidase